MPVNPIRSLRPFLSAGQYAAMIAGCRGEESAYFIKCVEDLTRLIDSMPVTYEQDGKGDQAVAHLHYFSAGSDWYITEKDMDGDIQQAYGYAILNGDDECAELGYISIRELVQAGVELDLHFTPATLADIKAARARRLGPSPSPA